MNEDVKLAREAFAEGRYIIVNDDSGHDYVIPMSKRAEWGHWCGSRAWEAGEVPAYAMRIEGTLSFRDPCITYYD